MRKILIGVPALDMKVYTTTLLSIAETIGEAHAEGWECKLAVISGISDIARARNALLGTCLTGGFTDLLFVDSDVSWNSGGFKQIMSHKAGFVAGAYRLKREPEEYAVHWTDRRTFTVDETSGLPLMGARFVAGGFLRLTSKTVNKLANAAPKPWPSDPLFGKYPRVFEWLNVTDDGHGPQSLSEDFTLCYKWRQLGGEVFVDPGIRVDHTGPKVFDGDLYGFIHRQTAEAAHRENTRPMSVAARARQVLGNR